MAAELAISSDFGFFFPEKISDSRRKRQIFERHEPIQIRRIEDEDEEEEEE